MQALVISQQPIAPPGAAKEFAGASVTEESRVFDSKDSTGIGRAGFQDVYTITDASREQCFNVINHVELYPQFLKIYSKTQVLSDVLDPQDPKKRIRVARYDISVPFLLKAFFRGGLSYTLKLTSTYDDATQTESMWWEQLDGPSFLVENTGRWDCVTCGPDVKIFLEMHLGYSFYLPEHIKKHIMAHILKDSMQNIQKRVLQVLGRSQ
jgi:hypothetical protein